MALKLMYITNRPEVAKIAEDSGVDRIFVDMEYIGKTDRQGGMDTVQNCHTAQDIRTVKEAVSKAQVVVRINPIHEATTEYGNSQEEINAAVEVGADILMLPFFKTAEEVKEFIRLVDKRAKTLLLVETPEAVSVIEEILTLPGIDEIFVGLNDLSLGYHKKFMFELLADQTVEKLCKKFTEKKIPYGFGGIGRLGCGMLPAEYVIREHYRLGSTCAILSRSFCNTREITDVEEIRRIFEDGLRDIRELERECEMAEESYFEENHREILRKIQMICGG